MLNNHTFIAIIPARGGSKRLPNKNMLDVAGKPMLAWTLEAAKKSRYLDEVVVSSDSNAVLTLAKQANVNAIKRPKNLATDSTSSIEVIKHALVEIKKPYSHVIMLQPTSPLRTAQNIDEAIELLVKQKKQAIVSVCQCGHSPLWANQLAENGDMQSFIRPEMINMRSQDLPIYYRLNGAIFLCDIKQMLQHNTLLPKDSCSAYIMPKKLSVDIDEDYDLILADSLLAEKRIRENSNT